MSTHPLARPAVHRVYAETFPPSGSKDAALLDICSSWISHYPAGYTAGRVAGEVMFAHGRVQTSPCRVQSDVCTLHMAS